MIYRVVISVGEHDISFDFANSQDALTFATTAQTANTVYNLDDILRIKIIIFEKQENKLPWE